MKVKSHYTIPYYDDPSLILFYANRIYDAHYMKIKNVEVIIIVDETGSDSLRYDLHGFSIVEE